MYLEGMWFRAIGRVLKISHVTVFQAKTVKFLNLQFFCVWMIFMPTFCGSDVVYSGCFMRISDMTKKPRSNGIVSGLQSVKFGGSSMFSCITMDALDIIMGLRMSVFTQE